MIMRLTHLAFLAGAAMVSAFTAPTGVLPRHSRLCRCVPMRIGTADTVGWRWVASRNEDKIPPYHLVSLDGRAQACVQLRMQGTDTLRRPFLGPVDHVLSFVGNLLEGAQKAAGLRLFKRNLREQVSMAGRVPACPCPSCVSRLPT